MYSKELLKPMTTASKLSRILLVSPWFLLAFLIVPAAVILTITFHLNLPFANPALLLVNNICFACLAACRLLRYLSGLLRPIRYGAAPRPRLGVVESDRSLAAVRGELTASGYLSLPLMAVTARNGIPATWARRSSMRVCSSSWLSVPGTTSPSSPVCCWMAWGRPPI